MNKNDEGKIDIKNTVDLTHERKPMAVLSAHRVANLARPMVDRDDLYTAAAGAQHRVTPVMPSVRRPNEYRDFARKVFERFLTPLEWDEIIEFELYLTMCDKPQSWKQDKRLAHQERRKNFDVEAFYRTNSSFIKDEDYDTWKNARTINGTSKKGFRNDHLSWLSRMVKSCEKQIYDKLPGLVKGMTPARRMEAMQELGDFFPKTICDYSSYEASFKRKKMECVQFELYRFMFSKMPDREDILRGIRHVIGGKNKLDFKHFTWWAKARKMSGESDTALSNAIDNWVTWLYLLHKQGVDMEVACRMIFVEGDDNASNLEGHKVRASEFEACGLKAKLEDGLDIEQTGFCQLYFTLPPTGVICADPWKKLLKFSKVPVRYARASDRVLNSLLRAQALSMLYLHHGAPVVHALARRLLYLTRGVNVRDDHWDKVLHYHDHKEEIRRMNWRDFVEQQVEVADRVLVERQFGMTIEMQLNIEKKLDSWGGGLLHLPVDWFPDVFSVFHDIYVSSSFEVGWFAPSGTSRQILIDHIHSLQRQP